MTINKIFEEKDENRVLIISDEDKKNVSSKVSKTSSFIYKKNKHKFVQKVAKNIILLIPFVLSVSIRVVHEN